MIGKTYNSIGCADAMVADGERADAQAYHPDRNMPGCMMPDGGECCASYASLAEDWHRLNGAIKSIAAWRSVNIAGEYEHSLRDIIRSITDCAQAALDARVCPIASPDSTKG